MKTTLLIISCTVTFLVSRTAFSQNILKVNIDTSFCEGNSHLDGKFGLYGTTRYGQQVDTLLNPLEFIKSQKIYLASDSFTNFRLVYTPSDTTSSEVIAPLYYFRSLDNTIHLDCYFFKKSDSLLDRMVNGDTLLITKVYRGQSHAGMEFPRSTLRIIKKGNQFYYCRNNLPTDGDCMIISYRNGEYEAGFSDERALTKEQLFSFGQFETEVAKITSCSDDDVYFNIIITSISASYKCVLLSERVRTVTALQIWEILN